MNQAEDALQEIITEFVGRAIDIFPGTSQRTPGTNFIGTLAFRQMATFQAVGVLLLHGFHSEAAALIRRQFEDNLRLAYILAYPEKADGLYYGHLREQFRRRVEEVENLEKAGMEVSPLTSRFRGESEAWLKAHEEAGAPKVIGFPPVAQMIRMLGRSGDILTWVVHSPAVHSALTIEDHPREGGPRELSLTSHDLPSRRNLTAMAGRYFFESYSNGAALLGYQEQSKQLFELYHEFRKALDSLSLTPREPDL